jgi:type 1 glutamine amidotransferase
MSHTSRWRIGAILVLALAGWFAGKGQLKADNELTPQEIKEGWQLLFDGKEAKNWLLPNGKPLPTANVQEGCINPHKCGAGWTYFNAKFGDFVLSLDFKIAKDCNSGVFFRVGNPKDEVQTGFEMQVLDSAAAKTPGKHDCGAIYDVVAPSKNMMKPAGEWNHVDITANKNIIQVVMNGEKIIDMDLDRWTEGGKNPDGTKNKFKTALKDFPRAGYIGVQEHGKECWYKNIKIKPLTLAKATTNQSEAQARSRANPGGDKLPATKHLLLITESKGFKHDCVNRKVTLAKDLDPQNLPKIPGLELKVEKVGKDKKEERVVGYYRGRIDSPQGVEFKDGNKFVAKVQWCLVESTMVELGKKNGFDVVCSQDARMEISPENLKNFDAAWFYTTGELPLSDLQKEALLSFVRSGKGFGGSHSATDTFYKWKDYGELIGAYFDGHPWHTKVNVIVDDKNHPSTKHLGDEFVITDEIYQFKGPYDRTKLHVLMRLEPQWAAAERDKELRSIEDARKALPEKLKKLEAEGKFEDAKKLKAQVEGRKPGIRRTDNDYAIAWTNQYGKGRVFYTALGHRDEVWRDPRYQQHVIGGLRFLFGLENPTPEAKK